MAKKIDDLTEFIIAYNHPFRRKILDLCSEEKYNITQLKDKMEIKSYKTILDHLRILEKVDLIKRKKQMHVQGKTVIIDTNKNVYHARLIKLASAAIEEARYKENPKIDVEIYHAFMEQKDHKITAKELKEKIKFFKNISVPSYLLTNEDLFDIELTLTKKGQKIIEIRQL